MNKQKQKGRNKNNLLSGETHATSHPTAFSSFEALIHIKETVL